MSVPLTLEPRSTPSRVPAAGRSELIVERDARGYPATASASCWVAASPSRVWSVVSNVKGYAALVPMLHDVRVDRGLATVQLRVGFGLFGSTFSFVARIVESSTQAVELVHVSGEPAGFRLRFSLSEGAAPHVTRLVADLAFDPDSLGWLASLFSKRHPELRYGIVPGCALALLESVRARAESAP